MRLVFSSASASAASNVAGSPAATPSRRSATSGPTVIDTFGGLATFHNIGTCELRGHTFSVPHSPIGITGAPVRNARRAAPQRPCNTGSKKARPRGMVPCGMIATISPASSAALAASSGASLPVPRSTRMPPSAAASCPMTGASNTSFLPRKRTVRPVLATVSDTANTSK